MRDRMMQANVERRRENTEETLRRMRPSRRRSSRPGRGRKLEEVK